MKKGSVRNTFFLICVNLNPGVMYCYRSDNWHPASRESLGFLWMHWSRTWQIWNSPSIWHKLWNYWPIYKFRYDSRSVDRKSQVTTIETHHMLAKTYVTMPNYRKLSHVGGLLRFGVEKIIRTFILIIFGIFVIESKYVWLV